MKKHRSILVSTFLVTVLIMVGKCFGFVREALIAAYYGASWQTDAFFFAQGMPSMLFPAVGNSLALAFTSLYVSRLTTKGEADSDRYASRMLNVSICIGLLLGGIGILLSPFLVPLLAPGFEGQQLTLAIHLTRLTMGAFVLIMLQYLLSAILNSKKFFIGSQVAGLLYNLGVISVTLFLGAGQSMDTLTLTVIFGMVLQVLALMFCCRGQFHYTFGLSPFHRDSKTLSRMALPILLGNCVVQINQIVDKALGSTLAAGSLSALSYAGSLNTLVISVFVLSLSTVLYPTLTNDAAEWNLEQFGKTLRQSLSGLSLILVPISCITMLCAEDIVEIAFGRGNFDKVAIQMTAQALACYAPRFVFAGMREVLTRGFFALQDTKTPMINASIGVGCNIVFSLLLVHSLGIAGIALGTTISSLVIGLLLVRRTKQRISHFNMETYLKSLRVQFLSGVILLVWLVLFRRLVPLSHPFLRFATNSLTGLLVYVLSLFLLKSKDLQGLLTHLRKKRKVVP